MINTTQDPVEAREASIKARREQMLARIKKAHVLRAEGYSTSEIGCQLGVGASVVTNYLNTFDAEGNPIAE